MNGARPPGGEWLLLPVERPPGLTRRAFLRVTAAAGGGLLVVATPLGCLDPGPEDGEDPAPVDPAPLEFLNAYVLVGADGRVTIRAPCPEIGQGVRTSLPMIVAEELAARWDDLRFEQAPADDRYGGMTVGGSDSVADYWLPLRQAGAVARALLVAAAAARWGVPDDACEARDGRVRHAASGRSAGYGELAGEAARLSPPDVPPLADERAFRIVGRPRGSVDAEAIARGRASFGIDVRLEDMAFAVVERARVRGARLAGFDDAEARRTPGVLDVLPIEERAIGGILYGAVRPGVAVLATSTWAAMRGREALRVRWDEAGADPSPTPVAARLRAALDAGPATIVRDESEVGRALARAATRVTATYELPLLAHACMEPVNFTASVRDGSCLLRGPTQNPRSLQAVVSEGLGIPLERVEVRPTLSGGGFGRRLAFDYGVEAAFLARAAGRPVQVVWTREDDLRHDYYRPPSAHRLEAGIDEAGRIVAWSHHLATGSLHENIRGPGADPPALYDVQGGADLPYDIPNVRFAYTPVPVGLQLGSWRSVSHSFNVYAVNAFVDEIASATGQDPFELQRRLLAGEGRREIELPLPGRRGRPAPDVGRLRRVLELAAERAGWGERAEPGRGRGIACCFYKETYAAHVAEAEVGTDGEPRIRRIVAAVDCGRVVNPDGARAQVEGAAVDAVATVLHWEVDVEGGRVRTANFDAYPLVRMDEAPEVEAHFVASDEPPSGMGEPPYPSAPPAIANAFFAAGGPRLRRLPVRRNAATAGDA